MDAFLPIPDVGSDYDTTRRNGLWYQSWQAGYDDILKRGHPRPKFKTTILADLYSPDICDFLHGGDGDVPFLVSDSAKGLLRRHGLTGFRFSKVEVAKIATQGKRSKRRVSREPEDLILKGRNSLDARTVPKLHAVYVSGRVEILPDYASGRCPETGYVTPFRLPDETHAVPDLWQPTIDGRTFAAWTYCSKRFKMVVEEHGCSNIRFQPFEEMMAEFRESTGAGRSP